MTLGILEAGAPPPPLAGRFDSYANMVRRLLGPAFKVRTYDVCAGELPGAPDECEAWLITGSFAGVYDPEPWIAPLKTFIQASAGQVPMVGLCFGHQLMAEAFGGEVTRSPKGCGIGLHRYEISRTMGWMDAANTVDLPVSHQDQVIAVGPDCQIVGGNAFTPFAILAYEDRKAFSIQAHPEFEPEFSRALIENRRGSRFSDEAIASLARQDDRRTVAVWMRRFLTRP